MHENNPEECECSYCSSIRDPDDSQKEHDKIIGWECLKKLDLAQNQYPMRLRGFSGRSRDEIARALLTLAKHDITLTDLQRGFKIGPDTSTMNAKEAFDHRKQHATKSYDIVPQKEYSAMLLHKVGRNYIDYEVPLHESSFLFDIAELWMFNEEYPRKRAREMGTDNASPGYRIIRVFANKFDDDPEHIDYNDPPGWNSAAETAKEIESYIYRKWENDFRQSQAKSVQSIQEKEEHL